MPKKQKPAPFLSPAREAELAALRRGGGIAKRRRLELGMTLEQVTAKTGLSVSFLSRMENGKLDRVTVVDLMRVANALDMPVVDFLLDEVRSRVMVTRAGKRRQAVRNVTETGDVVQEFLVDARNVKMEPTIIEVPPKGTSGAAITHEGEEFVMVLHGSLVYHIGTDGRYELEEGDAIYYAATAPHRWENPTRKRVRFLAVSTPPSY